MNLCTCCFDEVSGTWCGCEEQHTQDSFYIERVREYLDGTREMESSEGWSFHCAICQRPTYGTAYYYNN